MCVSSLSLTNILCYHIALLFNVQEATRIEYIKDVLKCLRRSTTATCAISGKKEGQILKITIFEKRDALLHEGIQRHSKCSPISRIRVASPCCRSSCLL